MGGSGDTAAFLFGRRTYEDLVGHWLSDPEPNPFVEILTNTEKFVVSRHADTELAYPNSTLLAGEAAENVPRLLEEGDGSLVVLGSGMLVRDLITARAVKRLVVTTIPVVLGAGTRLFDNAHFKLDVETIWASATGIVVGTYNVVYEQQG